MGSADPRAYSRNKRGIAGSLIGINFDRNARLDTFHRCRGYFVADTDEIRPQYQTQDAPDANALFTSSIVRDTGLSVGATINQLDTQVTDLYGLNQRAIPWYSDQVFRLSGRFAAFTNCCRTALLKQRFSLIWRGVWALQGLTEREQKQAMGLAGRFWPLQVRKSGWPSCTGQCQ